MKRTKGLLSHIQSVGEGDAVNLTNKGLSVQDFKKLLDELISRDNNSNNSSIIPAVIILHLDDEDFIDTYKADHITCQGTLEDIEKIKQRAKKLGI